MFIKMFYKIKQRIKKTVNFCKKQKNQKTIGIKRLGR